ncbi:hypothetical protein SAMN05192551_102248 [Tindallia magadiensis]|uniref:DUF2225 domain-containing protein n=1 Tax=Tindallia magadiensis TaxID=69895 RepID=A0A1I3C6I2_9FIRM|nr:DUF2225 domain-containing protein [Tindallia magadiensis]SFH70185.1 hypothetical protein SAMN05192551_102248 [Tindallia magadiensis]
MTARKKTVNYIETEDLYRPRQVIDMADERLIVPPGHAFYDCRAPESHEAYVFDQQVVCPVCDKEMTVKGQRLTKLKLLDVDKDFRHRFDGFEPLWYGVWVCIDCYYTDFYQRFRKKPPPYKVQAILDRSMNLKTQFPIYQTEPRKVNEVFASYYLALKTSLTDVSDFQGLVKIRTSLAWLYRDVEDEIMEDLITIRW